LFIESDIVIVIASVVILFALSATVAAWVNQTVPIGPLIALGCGVALLAYVHLALREGGLGLWAIPDAFIHVAAMVLR
jgi:hypothetical protein